MESLRAEIAKLERALADVDLHGRDPAAFERATHAYSQKRAELERAEDEWLELEILREEIEG
jgi:ATP-binding cassette subfamily F protein uup